MTVTAPIFIRLNTSSSTFVSNSVAHLMKIQQMVRSLILGYGQTCLHVRCYFWCVRTA